MPALPEPPPLPTAAPAPLLSPPSPSCLPVPPTTLIGRTQEVAAIEHLLGQAGVRLLTLTGPGGAGKTRLALEVGGRLSHLQSTPHLGLNRPFPDGVFFIDLAPVTEPERALRVITRTLGLDETGGHKPLAQLKNFVQTRRLLLILDNFEQVISAVPLIAEMLAAAPHLTLLITSRSPLHLRGEKEYPVPPLAVPTADRRPLIPLRGLPSVAADHQPRIEHEIGDTQDDIAQYAAVQMFVERARAVVPDFELTPINAGAVGEICRRLDGLPLAIELAAARVKVLTPQAMLGRLDQRLRFLTGGPQDLPVRQQTLRATLDWSYSQLTEDEQALFARLAVFVGGFSLSSVEEMSDVSRQRVDVSRQRAGDRGQRAEVGATGDGLEIVQSLVDKSLVRRVKSDAAEPRFAMLETIREYGVERLDASGEAETIRHRHALIFLTLAEQAEPELRGGRQAEWLNRLELDHDNIRASLRWTVEAGAKEVTLRLAGALWRFWWIRGYFSEGWTWLQSALRESADWTTPDQQRWRGKALNGAGNLAWALSDYENATACHTAGLDVWRRLGDERGMAMSLGNLGILAKDRCDYPASRAYHAESLSISRRLGDRFNSAYSLNNLGVVADIQGDYATATMLFEESLALRCDLGDERGIAGVLGNLGFVAYHRADLNTARRLLDESLSLHRKLGSRFGIANTFNDLGNVAHALGEQAVARTLYQDSLALRREIEDRSGIAKSLNDLGQLAVDEGDYPLAHRLLEESLAIRQGLTQTPDLAECFNSLAELAANEGDAVAAALRETIGIRIHTVAQARYEGFIAKVRGRLEEATFKEPWEEGVQSETAP